jgi:formate/nitrite transporter
MDHVNPGKLMAEIESAGYKKATSGTLCLVLKSFLAGALLAYGAAFAYHASAGLPAGLAALVSGAVFPVGFAMIVLLGLELVTGNFALLPFAMARRRIDAVRMLRNWGWVYLGNFLGCVFAGALFAIVLTGAFAHEAGALGVKLVATAGAKTLAYEAAGWQGWLTAFVKGVLCNWMVALGTVLALTSTSSTGKIAAVWLPVSTFFALGLEHSVVNLFVIPTAMLLGAGISVGQWLLWNQIPVTLGNLVGGAVLTGLLLHFANRMHGGNPGARSPGVAAGPKPVAGLLRT